MAKYQIKAPDGNTYQIEGPEGASQEAVQAEVIRQHPTLANFKPLKKDPLEGTLGGDLIKNLSGSAEHAASGVNDVVQGIGNFDPNNPFRAVSGAEKALAGGFGMLTSPITASIDQIPGATPVMQGVMGGLQNVLTYGVGKPIEYATSGWYSPEQKGLDANATGEALTMAFAPKIIKKGVETSVNVGSTIKNTTKAAVRSVSEEGAKLKAARKNLDTIKEGLGSRVNAQAGTPASGKQIPVTDQQALASIPDEQKLVVTGSGGRQEIPFPQTMGQLTNNNKQLQNERAMSQTDPNFSDRFRVMTDTQTNILKDNMRETARGLPSTDAAASFPDRRLTVLEQNANQAVQGAQPAVQNMATQSEAAAGAIDKAKTESRANTTKLYDAVDPENVLGQLKPETISDHLNSALNGLEGNDRVLGQKIINEAWNPDEYSPQGLTGSAAPLTWETLQNIRGKILKIGRDMAARREGAGSSGYVADTLQKAMGSLFDERAAQLGDPQVAARYREASDAYNKHLETFTKPDAIGDVGSKDFVPNKLLDGIVKPGIDGLNNVNDALRASPNALPAIKDRIRSMVDTSSADAINKAFDQKSGMGHLLGDARFADVAQSLRDAQAKLRLSEEASKGVLGDLKSANRNPDGIVSHLIDAENSSHLINTLREQVNRAGEMGTVWPSMRRMLVLDLLKRIESTVTETYTGEAGLLPGKAAATLRAKIQAINLIDPVIGDALRATSKGLRLMGRTAKAGVRIGSDTTSNTLMGRAMNNVGNAMTRGVGAHTTIGGIIGGGLGFTVGGPIGAAVGGLVGAAVEGSRKAHLEAVERGVAADIALDPRMGKALMMRASKENFSMLPTDVQIKLRKYIGSALDTNVGKTVVRSEVGRNQKEQQ